MFDPFISASSAMAVDHDCWSVTSLKANMATAYGNWNPKAINKAHPEIGSYRPEQLIAQDIIGGRPVGLVKQ
jgi:hypothetical protein